MCFLGLPSCFSLPRLSPPVQFPNQVLFPTKCFSQPTCFSRSLCGAEKGESRETLWSIIQLSRPSCGSDLLSIPYRFRRGPEMKKGQREFSLSLSL